jgi:hypothetical protein
LPPAAQELPNPKSPPRPSLAPEMPAGSMLS